MVGKAGEGGDWWCFRVGSGGGVGCDVQEVWKWMELAGGVVVNSRGGVYFLFFFFVFFLNFSDGQKRSLISKIATASFTGRNY